MGFTKPKFSARVDQQFLILHIAHLYKAMQCFKMQLLLGLFKNYFINSVHE